MTRISQRQMYSTFVTNMNTNLADLMESNLQGSSEKRINRPSDDPAGIARVLGYRSSLENITQYKRNTGTALGWLNLTDTTLMQLDELITKAKTDALSIATGTPSADQREGVAESLRGLLDSMISLGNTSYAGQYIFGGHKTKAQPYEKVLTAFSNHEDMKDVRYAVEGGSDKSVVVQFTEDGTIPPGAGGLGFRYSSDGGATWKTGTMANGDNEMDLGNGITVKFLEKDGSPLTTVTNVSAVDTTNVNENGNGTWLYVHNTGQYKGDDNDNRVITTYQNAVGSAPNATAEGYFTRDIAVRIRDIEAGPPQKLHYSYSLDDGSNWSEGYVEDPQVPLKLPVAGGYLELDAVPAAPGDQFVIKPHRADLKMEISPGDTVTINTLGKDIFGGVYQSAYTDNEKALGSGTGYSDNLMNVIGKLVTGAETNNQQMLQEGLGALEECLKIVTTKLAEVGGRENRVGVVFENLSMRELSETDNMSKIEDVDVTTLMTKLAQQQLAYNMVLKSSSMIMQMNLSNFI
ncbi:flagellar hook-associated protein FlgL [Desulfovibrio sp. OttesenSCG-928-I05]|nr:flagellar hook-associated protein FlgL [Desulfovibrio sp. OttesenSCG-928-I05]